MSTTLTCQQTYYKTPTEIIGAQVDFRGLLRQGEVLTGTPTAVASGLTISNVAVTTTMTLVNGEAVDAGKAVTFTIASGVDGTTYSIKVEATTSGSQTRDCYCTLIVGTS